MSDYTGSCPICHNEMDFDSRVDMEEAWIRWNDRLAFHARESLERVRSAVNRAIDGEESSLIKKGKR